MKRTTPPPPISFKTPREASLLLNAVAKDVLACSEDERTLVVTRARGLWEKAWTAVKRWSDYPCTTWEQRHRLAGDADYAVRVYVGTIYGDRDNPYTYRDRFATFAKHVEREHKAAAFDAEQREYRRRVGLDLARQESA